MKVETQHVPLSKLKLNKGQIEGLPKNPRFIRDDKYAKLKKSLEDDPEMLGLRELVAVQYNGSYVVIMGNMRLRALRELGAKDAPVKVLPEGTPPEKLRAFTVKDNVSFGEHDWDLIANEWDGDELIDWGVDIPTDWGADDAGGTQKDLSDDLKEVYEVIIECTSEREQEQVFSELKEKGYTCRVLTL